MGNLYNRVVKLETAAAQQADKVRYAPFSHDVIAAYFERRTPEGHPASEGYTASEWQAIQAQSESVFDFAAIERVLNRGEHEH